MRVIYILIAITLSVSGILHCGKKEAEKPVKTGTAEKGDGGYDYKISAEDMSFSWKIDKSSLKIKLNGKTKGWLGIGFNPTEEMKDANIIIGYVKNGKAVISDEFGISKRQHQKDTSLGGTDDITNPEGTETGDMTGISFGMPLQSKDIYDKNIDTGKMTTVILAYGEDHNMMKMHILRAMLNINFSNGNYELMYVKKRKN